jgi:hypothetical protein
VDSEDVDPAGSSLGNAGVVVACKSRREPEARGVFSCVGGRVVWMTAPSFVRFFVLVFLIN